MEDFQINEYLPLRDVVFETLRQKILKGELKPGERLIEVALAQRLGVSRTPVREAIHKLEQEGLVVMAPRKGAQVATISAQSVRDVLEVRKAMECLAVCLAISRITPQERIALRQAEEAFAAASRGNDLRLIAQKDEEFHKVIYMATKNPKLDMLLNNLREQMYRYRFEYIKDANMREDLRREHREITDAIIKGECERAKAAISIHIDNQEENILKIRSQFVPYYDKHNADFSRPYPGIAALLLALQKDGRKIAVASNKYQAATRKLIAHYFPEINFVEVLGQREGIPAKPDPSIVNDIIATAGVTKEEVLYVGDSNVDMQTAHNAGVTAVGVAWGFRPRTELEALHPAHIIEKAEELIPLLD